MDICLNTPLILREIFQNFSSTDLIQLSLVNKQWNYEARSLIRNQGNLTARVTKSNKCLGLRYFASDLWHMTATKKIIPFTGMTIAVGGCTCGEKAGNQGSSIEDLDDVYGDILDQITWKHFSVTFYSTWTHCQNCLAFLLVRKIFQRYGCTLEQLSLQADYKRGFFQAVLGGSSFPLLKTLTFQKVGSTSWTLNPNAVNAEDTILIKNLVSIAPNLQVLCTEERVDLKANLLEGSSAVHVTDFPYSPCLDEVPESFLGELRLRKMKLGGIGPDFNTEKFNRIAFTLLQNSRMTLSSMKIISIFLVPLMYYGISLENVRKLCLVFTLNGLEFCQPLVWRLIRLFDFNRVFPNLNIVHVSWVFSSHFQTLASNFKDMIEKESVNLVEPKLDRAENIKSVRLDRCIRGTSIQFLTQMLPHVQKLSIRSGDIPFASIWVTWPHLKELDAILDGFNTTQQFDSAFCGVFPEETALLQQQDEEYLRSVNIVPVMPSITCLKGLRSLNMSLVNHPLWELITDDPTRMLSKVTGLVAFQRLPALTVNLKTNNEGTKEALSHLKPYATVVLGKILETD